MGQSAARKHESRTKRASSAVSDCRGKPDWSDIEPSALDRENEASFEDAAFVRGILAEYPLNLNLEQDDS